MPLRLRNVRNLRFRRLPKKAKFRGKSQIWTRGKTRTGSGCVLSVVRPGNKSFRICATVLLRKRKTSVRNSQRKTKIIGKKCPDSITISRKINRATSVRFSTVLKTVSTTTIPRTRNGNSRGNVLLGVSHLRPTGIAATIRHLSLYNLACHSRVGGNLYLKKTRTLF